MSKAKRTMGRPRKYPKPELGIGEWISYSKDECHSLEGARSSILGYALRMGYRFRTELEGDSLVITRIE